MTLPPPPQNVQIKEAEVETSINDTAFLTQSKQSKAVRPPLPRSNSRRQQRKTFMSNSTCSTIGPSNVEMSFGTMPAKTREVIGDTRVLHLSTSYRSLFNDDDERVDEDASDTDTSISQSLRQEFEEDSMMPGFLADGIPYIITQDLVQGWLHKKGTGEDWMGSRAWKARWAILSLAKLSGHEVSIPLLQIFWHSSSPTPSTVIQLDSAVVVPEDVPEKTYSHRFQIRHVRTSIDQETEQATRIFACARQGRDEWCQAINSALLCYEKEKAEAQKHSAYVTLSPPRWKGNSWAPTRDIHPSLSISSTLSTTPPSSPRSKQPRNLPRHEPSLIGEALLVSSIDP